MKNSKWYLLCDINSHLAVDLLQIPDVWRNITGMAELSDETLSDLEWSENIDSVFLSIEAARLAGIDSSSIDSVVAQGLPTVTAWVRSMRDTLLTASDVVTAADRWVKYSVVDQKYITVYRQALRDITSQDPFNTVWPVVPPQLNFLRSLTAGGVDRPSEEFVAGLTDSFPAITLAEAQDDRWLLIRNERETRKAGGVKLAVNGVDYWFWTDEPTRNQYALLEGFVRRNALPPETVLDNWKTMSGDFVSFPVSLLYNVIDAGINQEKALFNTAETHRQAMLASNDPSSYDYTTGWSQTYAEFAAMS